MVLNLALVVGRAHERASPRHTNAHPHQVDAGGVYSAEFYMFWLVTAAAACSPAYGGSSSIMALIGATKRSCCAGAALTGR